jgi:hypothetical protein
MQHLRKEYILADKNLLPFAIRLGDSGKKKQVFPQ